MELFSTQTKTHYTPLAERLRPQSLADVVGQQHLLGGDGVVTRLVEKGQAASIILWGPPGCGKTTIAQLYANAFGAQFEKLSAVFSGVADLRKVVSKAKDDLLMGKQTVLFVDEIHRFNKAQQDAFLPYVEDGTIILVGATTENPSFELNRALLSRAQVLVLEPLSVKDLEILITRAESLLEARLPIDKEAQKAILDMASGDGRYLCTILEALMSLPEKKQLYTKADVSKFISKKMAMYDKDGEAHYDLISCLHKSIRGSDVDGALYWYARMLEGGEDPMYLARRLIRMASEEIAMADPLALAQVVAARDAYQMLGSPEGELALAQAVVYLALAPKSNAVYKAYNEARALARRTNDMPVPMFARNAPTTMMKDMGYNEGYRYDHDSENAFSGQNYFPTNMKRVALYRPNERGFEREMKKRLEYFNKLRQEQ